MSQHGLHSLNIRSAADEMGGKGMAQGVGSDICLDPGLVPVILHDLPEALTGHLFSAAVGKQPGRVISF